MPETNEQNTGINVLFVDSDDQTYAAVQTLKEQAGAELNYIHAKNAKEALEEISKQEIKFVVLEIVLPIVSGYSLISVIKKSHPNIPIFIYTRLKKEEDLKLMAKSGANNIFLKELMNLSQVMDAIRNQKNEEGIDVVISKLSEQIKDGLDAKSKSSQKLTQCPKCNVIVPPDSHFCNNCGQRIVQKDQETLVQKEPETPKVESK